MIQKTKTPSSAKPTFKERVHIFFRSIYPFWRLPCAHCGRKFTYLDNARHTHDIFGSRYAVCRACHHVNMSVIGMPKQLFLIKSDKDAHDYVKADRSFGTNDNANVRIIVAILFSVAIGLCLLALLFPDQYHTFRETVTKWQWIS